MNSKDFALLALVCFIWGANFVVTKWAISGDPGGTPFGGAPPIFLAALRFGLIAVLFAPFLRPIPRPLGGIAATSLCLGAIYFALMFIGLRFASASATAIALQLTPVFTTLLAIPILGERVGWRRGLGMALAFGGVVLVAWSPGAGQVGLGVAIVAVGVFFAALGNVMAKRIADIGPWRMQAWLSLISAAPLIVATTAFERGQLEAVMDGGLRFAAAIAWIVLLVSIFGFMIFYTMLRRYEASTVSFLLLMAPIWGMASGVVVNGDPFGPRIATGAAMTLVGVSIVALRTGPSFGAVEGRGT